MKRAEVWQVNATNVAKSWLVEAGYHTRKQLAEAPLSDLLTIPGIGDKTLRALANWARGGRLEREYVASQRVTDQRQQKHIDLQIRFLQSRGYEVKKKDNHESAH